MKWREPLQCRHCGERLQQDGTGKWVGKTGRALCFTSATPGTPDGKPTIVIEHLPQPEALGPAHPAGTG